MDQQIEGDDDRWICDSCGESNEEKLVVYHVQRVTRMYPCDREMCLCADCADRIPHGRVVSS